MKAVKHVIHILRKKGRRSVLAIPIVGGKLYDLNAVVEEAVKEKYSCSNSCW